MQLYIQIKRSQPYKDSAHNKSKHICKASTFTFLEGLALYIFGYLLQRQLQRLIFFFKTKDIA